jgi:cell division protein FtsL
MGLAISRQHLFPIFLFLALVFIISIFYVWSRTELVRLEYEISRMERKLRDLKQDERCMQLEIASLRSPQRIEEVARNDLGMVRSKPEQLIIIK